MDRFSDRRFNWFTRLIALATHASFAYNPTPDDIKEFFAKVKGVKLSKIDDLEIDKQEFLRCE